MAARRSVRMATPIPVQQAALSSLTFMSHAAPAHEADGWHSGLRFRDAVMGVFGVPMRLVRMSMHAMVRGAHPHTSRTRWGYASEQKGSRGGRRRCGIWQPNHSRQIFGPAVTPLASFRVEPFAERWQPPFSHREKKAQLVSKAHKAWHCSAVWCQCFFAPAKLSTGLYMNPETKHCFAT